MQCWIYGDSLRDYVVGLFVLDPDQVKKYEKNNGDTKVTMEDEKFRNLVYADMMKLANENKLNSLERPKQITLLMD